VINIASGFIGGIISVTIGVIVLANVFMPVVKGTNTSEFTTAELALWGTLGIAGVVGLVYGVFAIFGLA